MKDFIKIFGRWYAIEDLKDKFVYQIHCGLFAIGMVCFIFTMLFIMSNELTIAFSFLCGLIGSAVINHIIS